ncbi:AAA family ATPase [Dolichospermum sp. ST_con]|nr:AAA family ATPase [Dolichospermum sp. ST_con]MDD1420283.1 AAA family ATPase [Dolichospermum sp. ST_sed1]MDD1426789.1 AAA family ATPase [Dolichospermum sp. ST_sed9]MDD1433405.1 AAA family ATPase [Dolichospermum sp. ST_sed6]MDD1442669.1 AAA family ATPase [Dolichospermum sp. ST_sed3]MDD1448304.1 AAA family ATPase [Dolichospermum sp. ST_sed8]MDD1456997.1 AAA family ATPase [Dolichospermum sp. ST_sed7]MDD1459157.1 AAA family ATPase [Dolichospermum sp. ST_sed2]MDD1467634.1 AAA family ATPase [Do
MSSERIKNSIFSEKTFELMSKFSEHILNYDNIEKIEELPEYNFFREYVEKPFQRFCQELDVLLHPHLKKFSIEKDKIQETPYNYGSDFCLRAYFTINKLLFVEITQWGINTGINHENYQEIIQDFCKDNSQEFIDLLATNSSFFIHKDPVYFAAEDILNMNGGNPAIYDIKYWFEQHLPLVLLTLKNEHIPFIKDLSFTPGSQYFYFTETDFIRKELECWLRAIHRKGQAIIYGSPGTGKTFIAQQLAQKLIGQYGFIELVQFHPAYTYEDFIQGIRPQSEDGKLTYPLVPGRFLEFCQKAEICQDVCVLIIDEINRANLSQVFGELMYLLEYRDQEIPLAGGNRLRIPKNVRIIGTMNTADRSIAQIDHALRRRFAFIELRPNYDILIKYHLNTDFIIEDLIKVLKQLNQVINDKNYEIGISFFLTPNLREDIEDIWKMEIEPYLEEYFFNNLEKVDQFRWNKIEKRLKI